MWNTGGTVSRRMVNGDCDRKVDRRGRSISSASDDEWVNQCSGAGQWRKYPALRDILRFKHELAQFANGGNICSFCEYLKLLLFVLVRSIIFLFIIFLWRIIKGN